MQPASQSAAAQSAADPSSTGNRWWIAAALAGAAVALSGCGSDATVADGSTNAVTTVTETVRGESGGPTSADDTGRAVRGAPEGDEYCAEHSVSRGPGICVLKGTRIDGDLTLSSQRVVKLIGTRVAGSVRVDGARQTVITGSTVGGSVTIVGAQHATVARTTVAGDLTCDVRRADGGGNRIAGTVGGACSSIG
ncbi:hypothetical protein [Gordonia shandongensis]|uniref:hypothetical protein n=1 Tax=Gordonia shandongensis TaxID=376351 RepID=UPI0003F62C3D|nr:hypothetical protein [Gordonia shandongensis]